MHVCMYLSITHTLFICESSLSHEHSFIRIFIICVISGEGSAYVTVRAYCAYEVEGWRGGLCAASGRRGERSTMGECVYVRTYETARGSSLYLSRWYVCMYVYIIRTFLRRKQYIHIQYIYSLLFTFYLFTAHIHTYIHTYLCSSSRLSIAATGTFSPCTRSYWTCAPSPETSSFPGRKL